MEETGPNPATPDPAAADPAPKPSYKALLTVPSLGRVLLSMQIARIAQSMVSIVMILFALQRYNDPSLAGLVAFASIAPGMLVSPIAGALLDRHGRVRLIILDYAVVAAALGTIAALSIADDLPAWLLIVITAIASVTGPLSSSGLRSLFPLMVPEPLWERVNAVDSNGWVLATVVGAPMGAVIAQIAGFETAMLMIAAAYLIALVRMIGAPDPRTDVESTGNLLRDSWLGLVYTWNNRTLRGLAVSLSTMNLAGGMAEIVIPVMVLRHLGLTQDVVGFMFGLMGACGVVSAFFSGRLKTEGRERPMILAPSAAFGVATAMLLLPAMGPAGLLPIILYMVISGLANGPIDIAMFTLRQRKTDPAWMGRAFTVSMNLNFSGFPIGAAITGAMIAVWPIEVAICFGIAANVVGVVMGYLMLPRSDEEDAAAQGSAGAEPKATAYSS